MSILPPFFLFALAAAAQAAGSISWKEDCNAQSIAAIAQAAGQPVMVGIFASWCPACRELEANVLSRADVIELASSFVAVRCNGDSQEGENLMAAFHAVGFPTILFLDRRAKEIDRLFDNTELPAVVAAMKDIRGGRVPLNEVSGLADRQPDNIALQFEVGSRWAYRGEEEKAMRYLDRVLQKDAGNARGLASQTHLTLGKFLYLRGKREYQKAIETLRQLRSKYPEAKEAMSALVAIAQAYLGLGKQDEAFMALSELVAERPEDPAAYNAFAWFCHRHRFRLEQGLAMAKKGLDIDPADDGLWDTLAELQFAAGRKAEAVKSAEQALKLKPQDSYYKSQLEKFRPGL